MPKPSRPATSLLCTADLVEQYLAARSHAGLAASTLEGYRRTLGKLALDYETLPLDPAELQAFIKNNPGTAPDTLRKGHRTVHTFYNWLIAHHWLRRDDDPFLVMEPPVNTKPPLPRILSPLQMRRVVETSRGPL